jgi:hypothetical protein
LEKVPVFNDNGALPFVAARQLYRSGPSRDWLKVKNPDSPAMIRVREAEW